MANNKGYNPDEIDPRDFERDEIHSRLDWETLIIERKMPAIIEAERQDEELKDTGQTLDDLPVTY